MRVMIVGYIVGKERRNERERVRTSGAGVGPRTCFASTAWVNSGEKATCVIETSSRTRLKRSARRVRFSRTSLDTCVGPRRGLVRPRGGLASWAWDATHLLALGDDLAGVELSDNTLEDLVNDRRQYTLVVVGA